MATDVQHTFDRVYPVPPDALFAAVKDALTHGKYKKTQFDDFTKSVSFKSAKSFTSWGHHWQGQVLEDSAGSRLHLTGASFTQAGGNPSSSAKLAVKRSEELFAEVSRRCAGMSAK